MIRETYKGRQLKIRTRAKDAIGQRKVEAWIGGEFVHAYSGMTEEQVLDRTRRDVDAIDRDPRPDAYPACWRRPASERLTGAGG